MIEHTFIVSKNREITVLDALIESLTIGVENKASNQWTLISSIRTLSTNGRIGSENLKEEWLACLKARRSIEKLTLEEFQEAAREKIDSSV